MCRELGKEHGWLPHWTILVVLSVELHASVLGSYDTEEIFFSSLFRNDQIRFYKKEEIQAPAHMKEMERK